MKRSLAPIALACGVLLAPLPAAGPAPAEDERLATFFKAYLDEELKQRPLEATCLGDHRFDHLLDDVSPKARARWARPALPRRPSPNLPRRVDYKKLSRGGQIDFGIFEHHLKRELWLAETPGRSRTTRAPTTTTSPKAHISCSPSPRCRAP